VLINWFTVIAQLINFIILVFLLKRFLYQPILNTMHKRQKHIESQWQEAEQEREKAKKEASSYRRQQQQLNERRNALMSEAKEKAEQHRQTLVKNARDEVDQIQAKWQASVRRKQRLFFDRLQEKVSEKTVEITRKILFDLAEISLEQQVVSRFIGNLQNLENSERETIAQALEQSPEPILIRSRFELSEETQNQIFDLLQQQIFPDQSLTLEPEDIEDQNSEDQNGQAEPTEAEEEEEEKILVQFEPSSDLICGIELLAGGYELAWSFHDYLQQIQRDISEVIQAEIRQANQQKTARSSEEKLQQQLIEYSCEVARHALKDIVDASLEEQAIATFLKRLQSVNFPQQQQLAQTLQQSDSDLMIRSSFEIPDAQKQEIIQTLEQVMLFNGNEQEIKFKRSPDLICGIELQLAGNEIVWSLDRYVQNLDERFSMLLKEEDRAPSFRG